MMDEQNKSSVQEEGLPQGPGVTWVVQGVVVVLVAVYAVGTWACRRVGRRGQGGVHTAALRA